MTALVILAAGESKRMGRPKQNLLFKGKTLLQIAVDTALASSCRPVIVVLGANSQIITPTLNYPDINILYNDNWKEGMASSIRAAVSEVKSDGTVDSILFMLCDQPFVSTALIEDMLSRKQKSGKGIVACTYDNIAGVPMLFSRAFFAELSQLKGQEGAKKILQNHHPDDIILVPFDKGDTDIDTPEDYRQLIG